MKLAVCFRPKYRADREDSSPEFSSSGSFGLKHLDSHLTLSYFCRTFSAQRLVLFRIIHSQGLHSPPVTFLFSTYPFPVPPTPALNSPKSRGSFSSLPIPRTQEFLRLFKRDITASVYAGLKEAGLGCRVPLPGLWVLTLRGAIQALFHGVVRSRSVVWIVSSSTQARDG